jgi:hypothetical protein
MLAEEKSMTPLRGCAEAAATTARSAMMIPVRFILHVFLQK